MSALSCCLSVSLPLGVSAACHTALQAGLLPYKEQNPFSGAANFSVAATCQSCAHGAELSAGPLPAEWGTAGGMAALTDYNPESGLWNSGLSVYGNMLSGPVPSTYAGSSRCVSAESVLLDGKSEQR